MFNGKKPNQKKLLMEHFLCANVESDPQTPETTLCKTEQISETCSRTDLKIDQVQNQCKPLNGVIVFVDVRAEHENRSKAVSRELEKLGATISEKFTKNVTHVVFKDGRPSTYNQVRKCLSVRFVSILWVDSCKSTMSWVDEILFPAKVPQYIESPCLPARAKRIKSLQPKSFEDEMCNSAKKAKRKRDRLNKISKIVDATPDQIICHDSQEYIKSSDLYKLIATPRPVPDTPWMLEFINGSSTETEDTKEDIQCKLDFDNEEFINNGSCSGSLKSKNHGGYSSSFESENHGGCGGSLESKNHGGCDGSQESKNHGSSSGSLESKKLQKKDLKVGFDVRSSKRSFSTTKQKSEARLYEKLCCSPLLKSLGTPELLLANCSKESSFNGISCSKESESFFDLNAIRNNTNIDCKNITHKKLSMDLTPVYDPKSFNNHYKQFCNQCGSNKSKINKSVSSLNHSCICSYSQLKNENMLKETPTDTNTAIINSINFSPKTSLNESMRFSPKPPLNELINFSPKAPLNESINFSPKASLNESINFSPKAPLNESINFSPKASLNESQCVEKIKKKKLLSRMKIIQQEKLINPTSKKGNISLSQITDEAVEKSSITIPLMEKLCLLSVKDTDTNEAKQLSINCFHSFDDSVVTKTLPQQKECQPSRSSERLKSMHRRSSGCEFKVTTMKFRNNKSVVCENTLKLHSKKSKNSCFPHEISKEISDNQAEISEDLKFSSNKHSFEVQIGCGLVENSGSINCLKIKQEIAPNSTKFSRDDDSGISDGEVESSCLIKSHHILNQSKTFSKLNPSLVATSLHSSEHDFFKAASKHLGGFQLRKNVCRDTTHLVSGSDRRTLNILFAIIKGCWLLSPKWVADSYSNGKWLPEDKYELVEYFPAAQISRIQRISEGRSRHATLLSNLLPIFLAEKTMPSHEELEKLILECGGKLTASLRKAGMGIGHIKCRRQNLCAVSEKWLLDSISNGQVLSTQSYEIQTHDRDESPEF